MNTSKPNRSFSAIALASLVALALVLTAITAQAAPRVGTVTIIKGKATVTRQNRKTQKIKVGTPIYQNDNIKTAVGGKLRVVFIDRSIISVGSNSSLTITEYVFSPAKKERAGGIRLAWGKVKCFVNNLTGYRKKKFEVRTNTAVIGVRGTIFLVEYTDAMTKVAAFENAIEVVILESQAVRQVLAGSGVEILPSAQPGEPPTVSGPIQLTPELIDALEEGLLNEDLGLTPEEISSARELLENLESLTVSPEGPGMLLQIMPTTTTTTTMGTSTTTTTTARTTTSTTTTTTTTTQPSLPGFPGTP